MSKETKLILPHYYISVEEPYKKDKGCVCIAKAVDKNNVSIIEQTYRNDIVKFFIELIDYVADLEAKLAESEKTIEELKGERLKFYTDDVRRTQVINGVHFDMEQLLVFSEYVEHEKWVIAEQEKEINELKQQHQDKISFAVEQLEKVKSIVEDIQCACGDDYNISRDFLIEEIDNQIKAIKEME